MDAETPVDAHALLAAARGRPVDALERLLGPRIDVNRVYAGERLLDLAAAAARPENVELLLARGADPRLADGRGTTALHRALDARPNIVSREQQARERIARALLAAGADPHATDARGRTVFWHACNLARGKATGLVAAVLALEPDLLAADDEGFSVLHMAAGWDHREVLRRAIAAGGDVNATFTGGKRTAVGLAAARGHHEVLRMLLDAGARPDPGGPPEQAPLTVAAWDGDLVAVRMLVERGADPTWLLAELDSGRRTGIRGRRLEDLRRALGA